MLNVFASLSHDFLKGPQYLKLYRYKQLTHIAAIVYIVNVSSLCFSICFPKKYIQNSVLLKYYDKSHHIRPDLSEILKQ